MTAAVAVTRGGQPPPGGRKSGEEVLDMRTGVGGVTPLMTACQEGHDRTVRQLLHMKPGMVHDRDRSGKTALHYCTDNPTLACIDQVVAADPDLLSAREEDGHTPLHLATIAGNRVVAKYLLTRGANVDALDDEKHTAIHWATVCGEAEMLELLLEEGGDASTADIHGAYPIHYAAQMCGPNGDLSKDVSVGLKVLQKLLQHGVPVNVQDRDGRQPLLWAASSEIRQSHVYCPSGSADAILVLINAGARVDAEDKDGLTALHCAASRGHLDCLDVLITLCNSEVDMLDNNGCSPLFYSVTLGHADCTELLLNHGAEANRQDRKGRTPAHCGAAKGQMETLRLLHKHAADLWKRNIKGDLPLHEACQSGRKDLVTWLLAMLKEMVNAANSDGRTPLHIAAINNNTEMCKILMDHKAAVNPIMRNSRGQLLTPVDAAVARGNKGCAKYLQLHGAVSAAKLTDKRALQAAMTKAIEGGSGDRTGATPSSELGYQDLILPSSAGSNHKSQPASMSPHNTSSSTNPASTSNFNPSPTDGASHEDDELKELHQDTRDTQTLSSEVNIQELISEQERLASENLEKDRKVEFSTSEQSSGEPFDGHVTLSGGTLPHGAMNSDNKDNEHDDDAVDDDDSGGDEGKDHTNEDKMKGDMPIKEKQKNVLERSKADDEYEREIQDKKNKNKKEKKRKKKPTKHIGKIKQKAVNIEDKMGNETEINKSNPVIKEPGLKQENDLKVSESENVVDSEEFDVKGKNEHKEEKTSSSITKTDANESKEYENNGSESSEKSKEVSGESMISNEDAKETLEGSCDSESQDVSQKSHEMKPDDETKETNDQQQNSEKELDDEETSLPAKRSSSKTSRSSEKKSSKRSGKTRSKSPRIDEALKESGDINNSTENIPTINENEALSDDNKSENEVGVQNKINTDNTQELSMRNSATNREDGDGSSETSEHSRSEDEKTSKCSYDSKSDEVTEPTRKKEDSKYKQLEIDVQVSAQRSVLNLPTEETLDESNKTQLTGAISNIINIEINGKQVRKTLKSKSAEEEEVALDAVSSSLANKALIRGQSPKKSGIKTTTRFKSKSSYQKKRVRIDATTIEKTPNKHMTHNSQSDNVSHGRPSDVSRDKLSVKSPKRIPDVSKERLFTDVRTHEIFLTSNDSEETAVRDLPPHRKKESGYGGSPHQGDSEMDLATDEDEKLTKASGERRRRLRYDTEVAEPYTRELRSDDEENIVPPRYRKERYRAPGDGGFGDYNDNLPKHLAPRRHHPGSRTAVRAAARTPGRPRPLSGGPEKVKRLDDSMNSSTKRYKHPETEVSITQAMQTTMRKYTLERRLFQQLLELKRQQIRNSRVNETVLIKRMAEANNRDGALMGLRGYGGAMNFLGYEKYLYDQLRFLQSSQGNKIPHFKPTDDVDKLNRILQRSDLSEPKRGDLLGRLVEEMDDPMGTDPRTCYHRTHRCHHAAHAYTGIPCAAYLAPKGIKFINRNKTDNTAGKLSLPRIGGGKTSGAASNRTKTKRPPRANNNDAAASDDNTKTAAAATVGVQDYDPNNTLTVHLQSPTRISRCLAMTSEQLSAMQYSRSMLASLLRNGRSQPSSPPKDPEPPPKEPGSPPDGPGAPAEVTDVTSTSSSGSPGKDDSGKKGRRKSTESSTQINQKTSKDDKTKDEKDSEE